MSFNETKHNDDILSKSTSAFKLSDQRLFLKAPSQIPLQKQSSTKALNGEKASSKFSDKSASTSTSTSSSSSSSQSEGPREITGWRRAITQDKPAIKQLQNLTGDVADILYRKRNIDELIERSCFPIVQLDSNGDLISFAAYDSYPNIPSVPSFYWTDWLVNKYRLQGLNSRNVLFVHYMVWQPEQATRFFRLLLETSFLEFIHLKHIILVKPPKANVPDFYTEYFFPVLPIGLEEFEYDSIQSLLVCLRSTIVQPLSIRIGLEEDFESIAAVFYHHKRKTALSPLELFNFIYRESRRTLICEVDGVMAGVMVINLNLEHEVLNNLFELGPFGCLKKPYTTEDIPCGHDFVTNTPIRTSLLVPQEHANIINSSEFLFSQMNWEMMLNKIGAPDFLENASNISTDSDSLQLSFGGFSDIRSTDTEQKTIASVINGKNDVSENLVVVHTAINNASYFCSTHYEGPSNAFVIDLFAIDSNKLDKKTSLFDFIKYAFFVVPDREYCVLVVPTECILYPILDLFVRVTPKPMSNYKCELYVCHKHSLSAASLCVKKVKKDNLPQITAFLKSVKQRDVIFQDVLNSCNVGDDECSSFFFTIEEQVVGISLIEFHSRLARFDMHFKVSDYIPSEQCESENQSVIKHLIINPIYEAHTRFFIGDIMRLTSTNSLYYVCSKPNQDRFNVITVIREFVPVKPKRKAGTQEAFQSVQNPEANSYKFDAAFGLFLVNSRLLGLSKLHLNIVIVIVGASRTALSFLENLIYGPTSSFICYNNLTCVTPQVLETGGPIKTYHGYMFPHEENYSRKYSSLLAFESYVNFIYGVMTNINRSEKYIVVNNNFSLRYDYLILTCGLQYRSPVPKRKDTVKQDWSDVYKRSAKEIFYSSLYRFLPTSKSETVSLPKQPVNMFVINTSSDAKNALRELQYMMHKVKNMNVNYKKIIVYGHDLNAFLTVQTLLKLGIPGELIVFVEPFPEETQSVSLFNNPNVDKAVLESLQDQRVTCYLEYFLYDWSVSADDYIASCTFHGKRKQVLIPCLAMFPFTRKVVSDITFHACNESGLVYDRKLVINHNFRTNDDYIYAAGPFTKYSRRYYAVDKEHMFYDSTEVGQKLAQTIRKKVDPTAMRLSTKEDNQLPKLVAPLLICCQLPGDFNFFALRKPGKEIPLETAFNFLTYGEVLITGSCNMAKGIGYFRLHLSPGGFVESITCYTKDKIDFLNLVNLYGLHERLLNNLLYRYDLALIRDFFDYFRQPWAAILFHENFHVLQEYNYKAFSGKPTIYSEETLMEKLDKEIVSVQGYSVPDLLKKEIQLEYHNSDIERQIKYNLLEFLECFQQELPTYAITSRKKWVIDPKSSSKSKNVRINSI